MLLLLLLPPVLDITRHCSIKHVNVAVVSLSGARSAARATVGKSFGFRVKTPLCQKPGLLRLLRGFGFRVSGLCDGLV